MPFLSFREKPRNQRGAIQCLMRAYATIHLNRASLRVDPSSPPLALRLCRDDIQKGPLV